MVMTILTIIITISNNKLLLFFIKEKQEKKRRMTRFRIREVKLSAHLGECTCSSCRFRLSFEKSEQQFGDAKY